MPSRQTISKGEETIYAGQSKMRDNYTYMNSYPLYQSTHEVPIKSITERYMNSSKITPDELADSLKKMVVDSDKADNSKVMKYFRSITSKPIFSNMPRNFNESDYPLDDSEMLRVCTSKVFEIKNYFNYLYEEQIDKMHRKVMERNRQIELMAQAAKIESNNDEFKPYEESKTNKQEQLILDPIHIKYSEPEQTFNPKQKKRMQLSKAEVNSGYGGSQNYRYGW